MRPLSRFVLVAALALGWSSLASAGTPDGDPSIDPSHFSMVADVELDSAFESAMGSDISALYALGGPSTMDCKAAVRRGELETCVVRADGDASTVPAALAQH